MSKALKTMNAGVMAIGMLFGAAAHAELVTNGGFETGDLTGWHLTGSADMNFVAADPAYVHSGDNAAFFSEFGGVAGIAQQLATTAGQTYSLKFWLRNLGGSEPNGDTVSFFSFAVDGMVQPASLLNNKTATAMTLYDVTFAATAELTELAFSFRQDDNFWILDDVSVEVLPDGPVVPVTVPEPGTVALLFAAAAGWLFARVRRQASRGSRK